MKTALIHDWLVGIGGGEKVLQSILELYPSPIYTLIQDEKKLRGTFFSDQLIHSSFLQKLPFAPKYFRNLLPFFPFAIKGFDLESYDLILSSSHAVAKGIVKKPHQLHICYCHTPMRYAWDLYHEYLKDLKGLRKLAVKLSLQYLRNWDVKSAKQVDYFIANSCHVAKRIQKTYGKVSEVIYPPVNTHLFAVNSKREEYYITVSRLVPYKKVDLIVEAFSKMEDKTLVVIGDGPDFNKIKAKASKNIHLLGHQHDADLRDCLSKAKAFVFAAEEDFGIVPVEAQASGIPVIAYGRGGALETVSQKTGLFFYEQTVPALCQAIASFEKKQKEFDPHIIKQHAEIFNENRFKQQFKSFVDQKISNTL
ncbi:MAG TPA: glycosyltransferase [Rhabdochlamydiaceae bacterium]|nr:glycosyltransferase [Rhabdochlamydiaceae bacterium]